MAEHPDLTLTRLYNALEAHRAGKTPEAGMTPEEAADFQRASVVVLAELHAELDALTLDAYGWPRNLAGDAPMPAADRARWPKAPRLQVLAIKGALAEAAPLAASPAGGAATDIPRLLGVLQRGGQVRRSPDGRYALLRAT